MFLHEQIKNKEKKKDGKYLNLRPGKIRHEGR